VKQKYTHGQTQSEECRPEMSMTDLSAMLDILDPFYSPGITVLPSGK